MKHSRAPIGAAQYGLRCPRLIAASPPLEACVNKGGRLCGSLFAKNSLHPSFFSEYGMGDTQGQTLRRNVFIHSLRTAGWESFSPSWDWIRHCVWITGSITTETHENSEPFIPNILIMHQSRSLKKKRRRKKPLQMGLQPHCDQSGTLDLPINGCFTPLNSLLKH